MTQEAPPPGDSTRRVLLVEDDRETAEMVGELLTDEGFTVDIARDGQRGLHLALGRSHRVMIIDRGLPAIDGIDLITRLRRVGITARILVLTAMGELADRVAGLEAGADDYLVKPFELAELLARVRALARRPLDAAEIMPIGSAFLDLDRHEVIVPDGAPVALSGREFDLLRLLAAHPRTIFRRSDLRARLFPDTTAESIVDTYVYHLRRKLGRTVIRTVYGLGYQMGGL